MMGDNIDYGLTGGKEVVYEETDRDNGTVSGMSCTSGFTTRALELQQRFKRRRSKKAVKTKTRSDGLPEISEEYDIQTVVSGLTRNSEFPEIRDPPVAPDRAPEHGVNQSSEWPDDETVGDQPHHVIRVMEGDHLMSKNKIRSQNRKRLAEFQNDKRDHEMMKNMIQSHQKSRSFEVRKQKKAPTPEPKEMRSTRPLQNSRTSGGRKEKRTPLPEPKEERSEMRPKETAPSKGISIPREDPKSGHKTLLSPEPDGVKFRNGIQKVAIEPAGMKIETLVYGCAVKNKNSNNKTNDKPRRITPTIYTNNDDVEVVYQEKDPSVSDSSQGKFARRRSKSTNARKSTREIGYPTLNSNMKQNKPKRQGRSRSVDAKKRSRSLPRTLKRITSRYRKGADSKRDPSPSKRTPYSTDLESIDPNFIDEIFSAVENRTVSTLGSQCDGIESLASKIQEMKNISAHYSLPKFSPYSREEVFSSQPCEMENDVSEPRVCVEFGAKHFSSKSYTNQNSNDRTNYDNQQRLDDKFSRNYPKTEPNVAENASSIVFPEFKTSAPPERSSNRNKRDKARIDAIATEASRNLLLSPNGDEESFSESVNLFERSRSAPNSRFGINGSDRISVSATPAPERELRREFSGHKSSAYVDEPAITQLSMTPSGRKDLIQRYLALRDQHIKTEGSVSGGRSVSSGYTIDDANSITQSTFGARRNMARQRSGYDDASSHYGDPDADQWPFSGASERRSQEQPARTFPKKVRDMQIPSSGSKTRMRKSNSEGRNVNRNKENLFSIPNSYKQQANENWHSPSMVTSFPFSQQEKLSYSYASDDDSHAFDGYRPNVNSPYAIPAKSNYEEELFPHNQFMKMQIGIGNQ